MPKLKIMNTLCEETELKVHLNVSKVFFLYFFVHDSRNFPNISFIKVNKNLQCGRYLQNNTFIKAL